MELRTTRELRRNEQLTRAMAKKEEGAVPARPQTPAQPKDKLSVSAQALAFLERQALEREERRQSRTDDSLSALEKSKSELDLLGKSVEVLRKCQKIAASVMKGNRVPLEDLRYLMENDPDGYKLAMAMRRENPDPEDEKSVLDDEDRRGGPVEESGGGGAAPTAE